MARLGGKVALITGAAQGLGEAMARAFAREGARVAVSDVRDDLGSALARDLDEAAIYVSLNVTQADAWEAAVTRVRETFGGVDVLVNNAGVGLAPARLTERTPQQHAHILDVNLQGVYLGMRAVTEVMRSTGQGSIINISSIDGIVGVSGLTSYVASKFAVRGMTKSAALELGRHGIRVNSIHPGLIATPMVESAPGEYHELLRDVLQRQPIARMGTPEEVAYLALYLASDESSYCTGAEFVIDGGHTAGPYRWDV